MQRKWIVLVTAAAYATMVAGVAYGLHVARANMLAIYSQPEEQAHWDSFRETMDRRHERQEAARVEMALESGQPDAAKPPKPRSARPPVMELLENHYPACLGVSLLTTSGLFAVIWGMLLGAILRPGRRRTASGDAPPAD
ncbi:MAG: hypothetical protein KDA41_19285 [Planctomycetales bacterium]|nr:hypothetical protein [Planctomycetales bacterium]